MIPRKDAKTSRIHLLTFAALRFYGIFSLLLLASCTNKNAYKKVDVSKIKTQINFGRLEQDLFSLTAENYEPKQYELHEHYGSFYDFYSDEIMRFGKPRFEYDTTTYSKKEDILGFTHDTIIRMVYDNTQKLYAKDFPKTELEEALKHFQYYFPKEKITDVFTFISGFQYGAITFEDKTLGIGLDMYLGSNYFAYQNMDIPNYITRNLNKNFIVPKSMEAIYMSHFDNTKYNTEFPLLEAMVNEGKKLYFMECMQPEAPDSLIMGYSAQQLVWCKNNEKEIWKFFNEHDLLYKTGFMEKKRYIEDAPNTSGMPPESPGKVGAWVGWQIVRKYMRESEGKITLQDLLQKATAKDIIAKAHYKP